ncbi:hypothetical protein AG0111_0g10850 [Alternaria gaisen]|uniref:Uncharacterized protein n=1 Tax=Alternaria gaisen TaxID=167740 RepID=A0ACB6F960_9PLEO|nr:hypothetical protein AG0111_0g10850 [Alternaria gaisen]
MGRFDTLNNETKDLVECILPALAQSFGITDCKEIIPEDIRMRAWDCERRDHIKDKTENDPRNWGVQFLKDLRAISRLKNGNLDQFQVDLRAKVALHEPKHPWCRLADIKELKLDYEHPERLIQVDKEESTEESSEDDYFEELVEPDQPKGSKKRRSNHELYEARVVEKRRKKAPGRLRRSPSGGFQRHDKYANKRSRSTRTSATPEGRHSAIRRPTRTILTDDEDSITSSGGRSLLPHPTPAFSVSPGPQGGRIYPVETADTSNEPVAVQKLQAELEVAEAELKAARLKYQYLQAKEQAENESMYGGSGTAELSQKFD